MLKTFLSAFILWFDHFLDSCAEICQIFFVGFVENLRHQKDILKLLTFSGLFSEFFSEFCFSIYTEESDDLGRHTPSLNVIY